MSVNVSRNDIGFGDTVENESLNLRNYEPIVANVFAIARPPFGGSGG